MITPSISNGLNPLPYTPFFGFSDSAANKDMMSKMRTNIYRYNYLIMKKTLWERNKECCYEQFLLFSQCFQKLSAVDASK